jgi:hypothetical protein
MLVLLSQFNLFGEPSSLHNNRDGMPMILSRFLCKDMQYTSRQRRERNTAHLQDLIRENKALKQAEFVSGKSDEFRKRALSQCGSYTGLLASSIPS